MDLVKVKKNTAIIKQNEHNDKLYFLRTGLLNVIVGEEKIAELIAPGEVIGEISSISNMVATASIMAAEDCELYSVSPHDLEDVKPAEKEKFLHLLYKMYSSVVTNRLIEANEKSRQYEVANRELKRTKHELTVINQHLETEIEKRTSGLRNRIKELLQTYLRPSQIYLSYLRMTVSQEHRPTLDRIAKAISNSIDILKPVSEKMKSEMGLLKKKAVYIEETRKLQLLVKMALGGTGVALETSEGVDEIAEKLRESNTDIILVGASHFESSKEELKKIVAPIVIVNSKEFHINVDTIKKSSIVQNYIDLTSGNKNLNTRIIATTVSKLITRDIFGVEKYLGWGVEIHEVQVQSSQQRAEIKEKMAEYFKGIGVRTPIIDTLILVAEEMLMNAIYDAPTGSDGKPLFNHLPRTDTVFLETQQQAQFRYCCDGTMAAISIADPFGALKKEVLIGYIETNSKGGVNTSSIPGKGGAGRGLHQIVSHADLTVVNVRSGMRTEMISLISLDKKDVTREEPPLLHFFFN